MTTWNWSRYWPALVRPDVETGAPKREHLICVVEGGLSQPLPGATAGSRSKTVFASCQSRFIADITTTAIFNKTYRC